MASDLERERSLATITAALNDRQLQEWDRKRVQEIVTEACGGRQVLAVDEGGGLHEQDGLRIGAIRRTPSGEWFTERQNQAAEHADAAIPAPGPQSRVRALLTKLKLKL